MTNLERAEKDRNELVGLYFLLSAAAEKQDNLSEGIISGNLKRKANMFAEELNKFGKLVGNLMFNEDAELTVTMSDLCGDIIRDIFGGNGEEGIPLDKLPDLRDVILNFKETLNQ